MAVHIVSTKATEIKVTEEFLADRETRNYDAFDKVQNGIAWQTAGAQVTKQLNKRCYEYDECKLFVKAVDRMTNNERQGRHQFRQGQIAVVEQLPESDSFREVYLVLRLAEPGIRHVDVNNIPDSWPSIAIKARTIPAEVVGHGMQMGRKTHYPVRFYISTTKHRIQGETLALAATQIKDSSREYRL